jgi:hypothetical protein
MALILLVDVFLGFAHNSFEKEKAATFRFSKEFCVNPGNVPIGRRGLKFKREWCRHSQSSKEFCKFKSFWC